jgi:glycosyltransferase involved in cell wall biosynthesis
MNQCVVRVMHLVNSLDAGGMENGVVNMAHSLHGNRFAISVACLERKGAFANRLPPGVEIFELGKSGGFSVRLLPALRREATRLRPHVIHTHNLGPLLYAGCAKVCGGLGAAILHGEHSQLTESEKRGKRLLQRRLFYRLCSAVHTVSEDQHRELIALGLRHARLLAIPNGVDTERFRPLDRRACRERFGLPGEGRVIGLVGRFGVHKGHERLLRAFEILAALRGRRGAEGIRGSPGGLRFSLRGPDSLSWA